MTNACDDAWKQLKKAWERYRADPSKENRDKYFKVAVPRWRKERDGANNVMP